MLAYVNICCNFGLFEPVTYYNRLLNEPGFNLGDGTVEQIIYICTGLCADVGGYDGARTQPNGSMTSCRTSPLRPWPCIIGTARAAPLSASASRISGRRRTAPSLSPSNAPPALKVWRTRNGTTCHVRRCSATACCSSKRTAVSTPSPVQRSAKKHCLSSTHKLKPDGCLV